MYKTYFSTILTLVFLSANAQRIIFQNPGFEGTPAHSTLPEGWRNCGSFNESPPDTQPDLTFQVYTKPYEGESYVGMVIRDNATWEAMGAELSDFLRVGTCYQFSLALARSDSYHSVSRKTRGPVNYDHPTVLRIWGASKNFARTELLAKTPTIKHTAWQVYDFVVQPTATDYDKIILEVYYPDASITHRNGNLLVDAASSFVTLQDCTSGLLTAASERIVYAEPRTAIDYTDAVSAVTFTTGHRAGDKGAKSKPRRKSVKSPPGEPFELQLPATPYLNDQDSLLFFISNTLNDLRFNEDNRLILESFSVADETEVRNASPAWYACQHALAAYPDESWELVVYTDTPATTGLRIAELTKHLAAAQAHLDIVAYDAERHADRSWFCKSVANGLYLLRVEG